jgi:hypothetical protein
MADTYQSMVMGAELVAGSGGISTVNSTLATLVADGASPTQAHVTAVANAVLAFQGGALTPHAAVFLNVDTTQVSTASVLRGILLQMVSRMTNGGLSP